MRTTGLSSSSVKRALATLSMTHSVEVTATLLDVNHRSLMSLTSMLQGGQVNVNASAEITRSASVTLWDPEHRSGLDSKSPGTAANYYNRMIRLSYTIWRPGDGSTSRVTVPIFTGPVTTVKRRGGALEIGCVGKEQLAMHAFWSPLNIPKGLRKTDAIKRILAQRSGESRFKFAASTAKTGKALSYAREHIVWTEAKKLASSLGMRMFYDGNGDLVLRRDPRSVVYAFKDGRGGSLLSLPDISYDDTEVRNVVYVKGGTVGTKNKTQAVAYATLPANHPLNHNRMARNGVPRVYLESLERTDLKKVAECLAVAKASLDRFADQQLSVTFDALVNPFLEEGDYLQVKVEGDFALNFRLNEMSIPLAGVSSSIGQVRNLSLRKNGDSPRGKGRRLKVPKTKAEKRAAKKKANAKKRKKARKK